MAQRRRTPVAEYFGAELRRSREEAGLSRGELGKLAGYVAGTIAQLEIGKRFPQEKFIDSLGEHCCLPSAMAWNCPTSFSVTCTLLAGGATPSHGSVTWRRSRSCGRRSLVWTARSPAPRPGCTLIWRTH
jgi:DNA-binding XRE family transcriptional regulator